MYCIYKNVYIKDINQDNHMHVNLHINQIITIKIEILQVGVFKSDEILSKRLSKH